MPSITCFVTLKRLVRLVSMTAVQSSCVILRNTTSRVMPALFTSTSISPTSALTLSNAVLVDSQSPTLPSDAMKSKPSAFCSSSHFTRRGEFGPQPATTVIAVLVQTLADARADATHAARYIRNSLSSYPHSIFVFEARRRSDLLPPRRLSAALRASRCAACRSTWRRSARVLTDARAPARHPCRRRCTATPDPSSHRASAFRAAA